MPQQEESTPLLPNVSNSDESLLKLLDAELDPDDVLDYPLTPNVRKVHQHLLTATSHTGASNPTAHCSSPALQARLRQSFDHGFGNVWSAAKKDLPQKSTEDKLIVTPNGLPNGSHRSKEHDRAATVYTVFILAVITMMTMMSISPTLLPYMNEVGYTTPTKITPYVITVALTTAVPIFSNVILTTVASKIGPGRALAYGSLVSAFGLIIVTIARESIIFFMIGYALYTSNNSFRVIRVSLISKVVPPEQRTTVLATHALMTPLGALSGPILWIAAQTYRGNISFFGGALVFDRFSIDYVITTIAILVMYVLATTRLRNIVPYSTNEDEDEDDIVDNHVNNSGADEGTNVQLHPVVIKFADGHEQTVDLQKYRNNVFIFFCFIMCCANISMGLYMTAFQPILVNVFQVSDARLGLIYEIIAVFAVIPPLVVAILSRKLMDRDILAIGLIIKLIGMMLFLPIFGKVSEWQVMVGFLLIIKASIFFNTASLSLFTKLLGPMSTSSLLGILSSASAIGPAIIQIWLCDRIVYWFGSFLFGIFSLPTVVAIATIFWPSQWRRLNSDCEYNSLVTHEAELLQSTA